MLNIRAYATERTSNTTEEDLLVLSAAWYRIRKNFSISSNNITSLTDSELASKIEACDRGAALTIQDHYSKKSMMWALKGVALTKFRTDLVEFVHSDRRSFLTDDTLRLVFRLPEFYEYDIAFAAMKTEFTPIPKKLYASRLNLKLFPVKNLNRKLRSTQKHEYWLKDESGYAYRILIDHHNTLKSIWDREFNKEHLHINVKMACMAEQDEVSYFNVSKWEAV